MSMEDKPTSGSLADLPVDELLAYGRSLGLIIEEDTPAGEALRRVRERQELLVELDREAILDVVKWARRPVRQSAGKEQLAQHVAEIVPASFSGLSPRGLYALARLRGLEVSADADAQTIETLLRKSAGFWQRVRRRRRAFTGAVVAKLVREHPVESDGEYRFLPEDPARSIKTHIEEDGMVGGIARKLRGVADDYVHEKLDEIEARIDRKLDEIDKRMGEWRDREVSNRLRILKITLIVSIIVALLSLGYDRVRSSLRSAARPDEVSARTVVPSPRFERRSDIRKEVVRGEGQEDDVRTTDQAC